VKFQAHSRLVVRTLLAARLVHSRLVVRAMPQVRLVHSRLVVRAMLQVRLVRLRLGIAPVPILLAQLERLRLAIAPVQILMALLAPPVRSLLEAQLPARVRLLRRAVDCSGEYLQQVRWLSNPALRLSR
jgi:hypothetical protein